MREWVFKWPFWLKDLSHCGQVYLTPAWACLWRRRLLLVANVFGHKLQDRCFGFSWVWMNEWAFNLSPLLKCLLHCEQLYLTPSCACWWRSRLLLVTNVCWHSSQDNCFGILNYQLLSCLAMSFYCSELIQPTTFPFTLGREKKLSLSQAFDFKIQNSQEIDPIDELNHVIKSQSKYWRRRIQSKNELRNANLG